ncbi:MAG TPA: YdcF family protein [Thermodesulfobacteriota bacterium]|nr:YdcF family protein [Thermodesulfobacteriota bacterium]
MRLKILLITTLALMVLGVVNFRGTILESVGQYLITEDPLEKADAIILLGGSVPDRTLEAIDIYKGGYAPLIVFTMGPKPEGYDELTKRGIKLAEGHDFSKLIALKLGVPESDLVIIEKRADSTYSELEIIYDDFLKKKGIKSVILVTSKPHSTRASIIFNHVTRGEVKLITRPSKYDRYDPKKWWAERDYRRQTVFEYQKLLHHYLFDLGTESNRTSSP